MKKLLISISFLFSISCNKQESITTQSNSSSVTSTIPAHIIVVFLENHSYDEIRGNSDAHYINSLADSGTTFSNSHGVSHPSQPNYVAFFSGSQNGVTDDKCLGTKIKAANLWSKLNGIGKTCASYCEDLPSTGSITCNDNNNNYVRKHNPLSDFKGIPDNANKSFADLPTDFNSLENMVFITPNLQHDMHDGTIAQADTWIQSNLSSLAAWCKTNNSIFIITTDEDDKSTDNHILTLAYGQNVKSNNVVSDSLDHYNFTKTICSLFGAPTGWTDSLKNRSIIKHWLN